MKWVDQISTLNAVKEWYIFVDFLSAEYWEYANTLLQLPDELVQLFIHESLRISLEPELEHEARSYHYLLYYTDTDVAEMNAKLLALGPQEGMFAAVIYASGMQLLREQYCKLGISLDILKDTLSDFRIWMNHHYSQHSVWGLSELGWLAWHVRAGIYKLGRLQFMPSYFRDRVYVFRHRHDDTVMVLSAPGIIYHTDGTLANLSESSTDSSSWTSQFMDDGQLYIGNPISSQGLAIAEPVRVDQEEWELVLREGDQVLDVHIPEGQKMDHELCWESYTRACDFKFPAQHDGRFRAFVCSSWLLSSQLAAMLPESSNIVKFQRDYHRVPALSDDTQLLERVFGCKREELPHAPRNTKLQQLVYDYLMTGQSICGGTGFMLMSNV